MTSSEIVRDAGLSLVAGTTADTTATADVQRQPLAESGNAVPPKEAGAVQEVSSEELTEAVSNIADYVQTISRQLNFTIDEDLGSTVVTVLDRDTEEVVRQIPSQEALAISRYIADQVDDPVKGLLVQSEA